MPRLKSANMLLLCILHVFSSLTPPVYAAASGRNPKTTKLARDIVKEANERSLVNSKWSLMRREDSQPHGLAANRSQTKLQTNETGSSEFPSQNRSSLSVASGISATRFCFPFDGIEYITYEDWFNTAKGKREFLPAKTTMIRTVRADDAELLALRARWWSLSRQCQGMKPSPKLDKFGFGGQLTKAVMFLKDAMGRNLSMGTPIDPQNVSLTHYGLMPTSECEDSAASYLRLHGNRGNEPLEGAWPEGKNRYYWYAQRVAWVLRLNSTFEQHLHRLKTYLNWEASRPILGLHVRLGDVCTRNKGNRFCDDLATYMVHVERLADEYGYKSIYLATDSLEVVRNTTQYTRFKWIHSPISGVAQKRDPQIYFDDLWSLKRAKREFNDILVDDELRLQQLHQFLKVLPFTVGRSQDAITKTLGGEYDFDADMHDFLLDTMFLADSDGLVGKFTSNLDQLAYALGFGKSGCAVPYVSLDHMLFTHEGEMKLTK